MPSKQQHLDELAAAIVFNDICPQLHQQATQLVMGSGNPDAAVVLIGEAPGKKEDETGLPFVGASGRFLDLMLGGAGMERQDVYITNIVKYRPPSNRDPTAAEKAAFLPYLIQQLEIIEPRVVITLGRHSMACFLPDESIADAHGRVRYMKVYRSAFREPTADGVRGTYDYRTEVYKEDSSGELAEEKPALIDEQLIATWLFAPLYHPAAALYNGSRRQELIDDFIKVTRSLPLN